MGTSSDDNAPELAESGVIALAQMSTKRTSDNKGRSRNKSFEYASLQEPSRARILEVVKAINRTVAHAHSAGNPTNIRAIRLPTSDLQKELRALVAAWRASGPNLRELFANDPDLANRARCGKTTLYPLHDGYGHLEWAPITPESHLSTSEFDYSSPRDQALRHFVSLITNPEWALLGGPCERCGDYFIKAANRSRVYCSRTCSSTVTAVSAIKKKRRDEQLEKLARAEAAVLEYQTAKRRSDWKHWVADHTGLTLQWLSRAVNSGRLKEPKASPVTNPDFNG